MERDEPGGGSRAGLAGAVLGVLALVLAVVTVCLGYGNRDLQRQVAVGQQQVAKAQTMATLDNTLVQLLAKAAVESNDAALRSLLERNGVRLKAAPETPDHAR